MTSLSTDASEALDKAQIQQQQMTQPTESLTFMEAELYRAAATGQIGTFTSNKELQIEQLLTPFKNTVLHIYITASTTDHTEFVDEILRISPSLLLKRNADGEIPLHLAARYGHERIVKFLIEHARGLDRASVGTRDIESSAASVGAVREMLAMLTESENTALHEAVRFRHLNVVRILAREDPHLSQPANRAGETPFYLAAEIGYLDLLRKMLSVCSSINASGPNNSTALHAAVVMSKKGMRVLDWF